MYRLSCLLVKNERPCKTVCPYQIPKTWKHLLMAPLVQAERLELLSTLQQLPLKVRTEEQEAILQGLSPADMGALPLRALMGSLKAPGHACCCKIACEGRGSRRPPCRACRLLKCVIL